MSLLAETLVDEWLNRKGLNLPFDGIKDGVDEIDLLGVRPIKMASKDGTLKFRLVFGQ